MLSRRIRARIQRIARGRSDEPLRVLEGPKAVRDALRLGAVVELWLRNDLAPETVTDLLAAAAEQGVVVGGGSPADFDRLAETVTPQGVLALVRDTASSLEEVLEPSGLVLWLDGVQDPGNVGAIVRVAAAFGVRGLLVGEGCADPLGLKALRASAGRALGLPFVRASASTIATACANRDRVVWALDQGADDVLALTHRPKDLVLVVGAEGPGIGEEARRAAERVVGIPLEPDVDSLNAAVAAGIAVAHLARRAPP